ncbi:hypothetical protein [Campylobacter upsaliensis]|uniref:hypothetical protein n=1 Tax=Campylobacter upsaliensis TaxID=28080 RepID=UPI0022EA2B5C|nr:hypothetical protein [Campylobacter upsaliensis]
MAITLAVQKGCFVSVYDGNKNLYTLPLGPNDKLVGFTSSSVNIKKGGFIFTYDEKGHHISTTPA